MFAVELMATKAAAAAEAAAEAEVRLQIFFLIQLTVE